MFDQDHMGSKDIVVRQANENETMTTLDDTERTLIDLISLSQMVRTYALLVLWVEIFQK